MHPDRPDALTGHPAPGARPDRPDRIDIPDLVARCQSAAAAITVSRVTPGPIRDALNDAAVAFAGARELADDHHDAGPDDDLRVTATMLVGLGEQCRDAAAVYVAAERARDTAARSLLDVASVLETLLDPTGGDR